MKTVFLPVFSWVEPSLMRRLATKSFADRRRTVARVMSSQLSEKPVVLTKGYWYAPNNLQPCIRRHADYFIDAPEQQGQCF